MDIMADLFPANPAYNYEDVFFTCDDDGDPIRTFKFTDGSIISTLNVNTHVAQRAWTYDTIVGTEMVMIGY
jgi:hypothetical protein